MKTEQIVAVVPGQDSTERISIALDTSDMDRPISIRSESFSPDIGWFPQSTLKLSRSELAGLRNVLGVPVATACKQSLDTIEETRVSGASADDEPRVLSFAAYKRA